MSGVVALLGSYTMTEWEWPKVGSSMAWTQTQRGEGGWK